MNNAQYPTLIEPGVKYFLKETLKKCNQKKNEYYNTIWNCGFFLLFVFILGMILAYRKKHKLSPEEKKKKNERDHAYIITKMNSINDERRKLNDILITNLPKFESDYEIIHKKYYAV
jgi:hypothetical protein